jgi:hemerythrin superfamily protein
MDAITFLKTDHNKVELLFKRFEKAGDRAFVEKQDIVDQLIEALSVHSSIEEQLFYPVARATVPGTEELALESLEEHHIVKWVLSELEAMTPHDERFDAKVTVLIENVRHHVNEEEGDFFPKVRDELGRKALNDLGDAMVEARKTAPTHPHPEAPDTPTSNAVAGTANAVADRVGDTVSGLAQGSVSAVGDLIATVLRRKKPRVSPTGSSATRKTATKVRAEVSDATQAMIDATHATKRRGTTQARHAVDSVDEGAHRVKKTARTASRAATRTGHAAKAGAKATATTAGTSAKKTTSTARRAATTTSRTAATGAKQTLTSTKRSAAKPAGTTRRIGRAA